VAAALYEETFMKFVCILLLATLLTCSLWAEPAATTQPAMTEQEAAFQKMMNNAVLSGSYSVNGSNKPPGEDHYTLGPVEKTQGDNWIFTATLEYAGHHLPLPIELPVKWAGDTPIITVDHISIPTLGTFTARVMVFGDQYVGVWGVTNGKHSGQMWGHIEHPATQPAK
jgi:hypothetical protein